jgi:hypothetical protein
VRHTDEHRERAADYAHEALAVGERRRRVPIVSIRRGDEEAALAPQPQRLQPA